MKPATSTRRDFVSRFAPAAFFSALGIWGGSLLRFTMPSLLPQATKQIRLGMPEDYPPGTVKAFEEDRVMVFADEEGIYAISTTCTHLGCVVSWTGRGYQCPCHGSKFGPDGAVKSGPAPSGLVWHKVMRLPSGQLAVDLNASVKAGTKEPMYA